MTHQHIPTPAQQPIILSVVEVPELCAPDYCIVRLRNGRVLFIGDTGVNEFECEAAMHEGEPCGGMMFATIPAPGGTTEDTL